MFVGKAVAWTLGVQLALGARIAQVISRTKCCDGCKDAPDVKRIRFDSPDRLAIPVGTANLESPRVRPDRTYDGIGGFRPGKCRRPSH